MRVLWLGHFVPYPPRGGSMQRSFHLVREAAKTVELHFVGVSLRAQQPTAADVERARHALGEHCASVRLLPLPFLSSRAGKASVALRALLSGASYSGTWVDTAAVRALFARAVEEVRPDVLHVDSVQIAHLAPPGGPAAVLTHHNVESHMVERRAEHSRGLIRAFLRREARTLAELERSTADRYARHIVCSELDGERLQRRLPPVRCDVVPNGVDTDYFRPLEIPVERHSLIFAGRMNQYPNEQAMLRFLRELLPRIRRRLPDVRLTIAGMNPTAKLLAAAKEQDRVLVTGFVEDIRPVISAAAVYVCPMLDGGGTRLKLLDAMALARPIVATPLGMEGLETTDGEQARIAEFGEPFVDAVVGLLGDADARRRLGAGARAWVEASYGWEAIGARLVDCYRRAAGATTAA